MLIKVSAPSGLAIHLISQIDAEVERKPVKEQASIQTIEAQAIEVANQFAAFVKGAGKTLDICIYDFRLSLPAVSQKIVDAIKDAAARGVAVRVAFDANQKSDEEIIKQFQGAGGDPAPTGTHLFVKDELEPLVETQAIAEQEVPAAPLAAVSDEPIAPGSQIMHQKYMIADAGTDQAVVWMGSANFTVDAWALQDNNIAVISSRDLAAKYSKDFEALWASGKLSHTGEDDLGSVTVNGIEVRYAFAPGEGEAIRDLIVEVVSGAKQRIRIASMVTSSKEILEALKQQIDAGIDFGGVYDEGQSTGFQDDWQANPKTAEKAALLEAVLAHLVPKHSLRFDQHHPDNAHNFMHNKLVVADDTILTGSFNFSTNAMSNAENVVSLSEPNLAKSLADYIDGLTARYGAAHPG
jgi:phosphatidylserine/phosphatidylglycerophosphate/cardiolipin synthase-like enzyme